MQFLQPILLWGLLGISIPILIHLWQGKKGQVIHWAAMHWLSEQESSVAKGVRLENFLVLLLRILMLILLVLLLSQLYFSSTNTIAEPRIFHLFQPDMQLAEEYKFELQQALENEEEVYWADENLTPIESLEDLEEGGKVFDLQAALDKISPDATSLNLYLSNSVNALKSDFYLSPLKPNLFLGSAELLKSGTQVISIDGVKALEIGENGLLDSISDALGEASVINLDKALFTYFLGEITDSERVFVQASLDAITEVYGFDFVEEESMEDATLIFTANPPKVDTLDKIYFVSDTFSFAERSNLISLSDQLDFEHSELVQSGKLPEVILERFLDFSGVEKKDVPLSRGQLENRFLVESERAQEKRGNLNLLLLGLFTVCFAAERFLANRQGI
ncbi:BatA domain-containing protein [Algoriphagus yeomjeoni]|uniref:Putative membrane protein (TIGR02226 family) n=1 Tax=Algoriphagus yeomjeoni TaxID=291403 RepID=A0A327P883_9BACT|nr:BatA domain-containing protein [Algoriphagus yeomjeoni]RAI88465.1 putative membrane protein (TIGR02226 family) [Algoriphagus yeomjeoni]